MASEISTTKGVLAIAAMVGIVVVYAKWPHTPPKRDALVVVDVGYVVTTGTQRCQKVVVEAWCDSIDPRLPNMTRSKARRGQVRTDDCDEREKRRKFDKRDKGLLDYTCTKEYADVLGDYCRSERLDWVATTSEREVRGRSLEGTPIVPPPPPCGTAACAEGCTAPLQTSATQVVFTKRASASDSTTWRCPIEPGAWNVTEAGQPFSAVLAHCTQSH